MRRTAFTLLEVLVVLGIFAAVLAIVMPAVMQVRAVAVRLESMNNLKQITLAAHSYAGNRSGILPDLGYDNPNHRESFWFVLLPYIEHDNYYHDVKAGKAQLSSEHLIKPFISPADPTMTPERAPSLISYCANAQVFTSRARMPGVFRDGSSTTIMFAEHYGFIRNNKTNTNTMFYWYWHDVPDVNYMPFATIIVRRASFADEKSGDVYPVPGKPGTSVGSVPDLSFQIRPVGDAVDPRVAQTPHSSGMLVGMGDGSVRTLGRQTQHTIYWGLVTPAGNEAVSLD